MNTDIQMQIRRAEAWLRSCQTMRQAAESRLRAGGEHHEIGRKRAELRGAEGQYERALEELTALRGLAKRLRERRYG
jgi:thioredoxin-like negative regulator of GroEL